ncbi:hypothetical protein D9M70_531670 [compost metagenome]
MVSRIESDFHRLQQRIEVSEDLRREFRSQTLPVFAPEQPSETERKFHDLLGNLADHTFGTVHLHVNCRAYMQHPGVHVTEHAVDQTPTIQGCPKLQYIVGEPLRRDGGVFYECDWPALALHVPKKAHRLLAHFPKSLDLRSTAGDRVAAPAPPNPAVTEF